MINRYIKEWLLNVFAWGLISNFYSLAILTHMNFVVKVANVDHLIATNDIVNYFLSYYQYFEASLFGLTFGTLFYVINLMSDRVLVRKMPFGKIIILKTLMYIAAVLLVFASMSLLIDRLYFYPIDLENVLKETRDLQSPSLYISFFTFVLFTAVLVNFLIQVTYKFGPKTILPMFLGKYHKPKSENRIFLFLDLKNSTGIAEELGHVKYSKLIQDCYFDLNKIVFKYNADVYQYVGDEVVLTWPNRKNILNKFAIKTTFAFRKLLENRKNYYLKHYGFIPQFKGGLHLGTVSAAEIGAIKRDIAYHGDVVNTASRLQKAAKQYGKTLMVSESVINEITDYKDLYVEEMPTIELKGKKNKIGVFYIEEMERRPDRDRVSSLA